MNIEEARCIPLIKEHIPYELDMLNGTYEVLVNGIDNPIVRNAMIESFCIHCRNLIKFLKNKDDNLKVKELAPEFRHTEVAKNKNYNDLISHQIAHLSKKRVSEEAKKIGPELWKEMYIEISRHIPIFAEKLKSPYNNIWPGWSPINKVDLAEGGANTVIRLETKSFPVGPHNGVETFSYSTLPTGPLR